MLICVNRCLSNLIPIFPRNQRNLRLGYSLKLSIGNVINGCGQPSSFTIFDLRFLFFLRGSQCLPVVVFNEGGFFVVPNKSCLSSLPGVAKRRRVILSKNSPAPVPLNPELNPAPEKCPVLVKKLLKE